MSRNRHCEAWHVTHRNKCKHDTRTSNTCFFFLISAWKGGGNMAEANLVKGSSPRILLFSPIWPSMMIWRLKLKSIQTLVSTFRHVLCSYNFMPEFCTFQHGTAHIGRNMCLHGTTRLIDSCVPGTCRHRKAQVLHARMFISHFFFQSDQNIFNQTLIQFEQT